MKARVGIVGAGPGGLAAGVLLQNRGFEVEIFEASERVGGRNARLSLGPFHFDTGPTFLLMPELLNQIFHECKRALSEYMELKLVDPLYKLHFGDGSTLSPRSDPAKTALEITKFSKKDASAFWNYRERQKSKFEAVFPALKKPLSTWMETFNPQNLAALPYINLSSVYDELSSFFENENVRLAFTFQAKYLGMSPLECPSLFTILPHIEHELGVWHPIGGCSKVSEALAQLFQELGGKIHFCAPVKHFKMDKNKVRGFYLGQDDCRDFDFTIMNADFAHGMQNLFSNEERKKYKDQKLERMKYSCSTFMMYLGLKGKLPWEHHSIYFSQNYRKNIRELTQTLELSEDPSFYVQNACRTDSTLAPEGQSALYVLVPVPNLRSQTDWHAEKSRYAKKILALVRERTGVDLEPLIVEQKIISPADWQSEYRVFRGATFSLAHTWDQMAKFRPHNEFDDFRRFYLVGGGTHPGSGLPTILESGRIAAQLIEGAC